MRRWLAPWALAAFTAGGASCTGAPRSSRDADDAPPPDDVALPAPEGDRGRDVPRPPTVDPNAYEVRVHSGAGIAFELGAAWSLSGEESATLLATSPDERAVLMFHVSEPETLEQTLATIDEALAADVKDVYFGPATLRALGTLAAELATGAGNLAGQPVELGKLVVATPKLKVLVVVAVIQAAASPLSKKQARHTLESIREQP